MFVVALPVTPFTYKALKFQYGPEKIEVKRSDALFKNLSKKTFTQKDFWAKKYCTKTIEVKVPEELKTHLENVNIWELGYMLHFSEVKDLLDTIEFVVFHLKQDAMSCIKNYLVARDIDEDDYPLETAYKNWQRRKEKKIGKKAQFRITKRHKRVFNCYSIPVAKITQNLAKFYDSEIEKFYGPKLETPILHQQRKVILFLTYKFGHISFRKLANEFQIYYPQLHKNIKITEFVFSTFKDDELSIMINDAFNFLQQEVSPLQISLK